MLRVCVPVHEGGQPRWETAFGCIGAQIPDTLTRCFQAFLHKLPGRFELRRSLLDLAGSKHLTGNVQLQGDTDEVLSQRVVNLARHPAALVQHQGESSLDCPQTELKDRNGQARNREQDERVKPPPPVDGRKNVERYLGAGLVPDTVVVPRLYTKTILARRQTGVRRRAHCSSINPVPVEALQHVAIAVLRRKGVAEGSVIEGIAIVAGPYLSLSPAQRDVRFIDDEALDHNRWRNGIHREMCRVGDGDAFRSCEPQLPITHLPN